MIYIGSTSLTSKRGLLKKLGPKSLIQQYVKIRHDCAFDRGNTQTKICLTDLSSINDFDEHRDVKHAYEICENREERMKENEDLTLLRRESPINKGISGPTRFYIDSKNNI